MQYCKWDVSHFCGIKLLNSITMNLNKKHFLVRSFFFVFLFWMVGVGVYADQKPNAVFHAIVARDGSGNYTSVQSAIDAVPEGRTAPWLIFVKNGSYEEQVIIPASKPFIHLVGQDKERTIIHLKLNVGGKPDANTKDSTYWEYSVHNPQSKVYKLEGSVVNVNASDFYSENISYVNDWGVESLSGPQALAIKTRADRIAFYNCKFRSFQDTWMTTVNDADRHYAKECWIEGAVDYFYGAGDALLEECTLYNIRSGAVIVAPSHEKAKYGYVFRNCIIDGNKYAATGTLKLGRPWHNSPKAIYINTLAKLPLALEGWTNMGTIPGLFAEYNTVDINGKAVDLTHRKTEYETRGKDAIKGSSRSMISAEEADQYTYENIIKGDDMWNPRVIMEQLPSVGNIEVKGKHIEWKPCEGAIGYLLELEGKLMDITKDNHILWKKNMKGSVLIIQAINQQGALGEKGIYCL